MSSSLAISIAILLLVINAFFVASEFAVISVRREQITVFEGKFGYKQVMYTLNNASVMLACTQLGITLASTGLGVIAEPAIANLLIAPFEYIGLSKEYAHGISFAIALLFVVFMHVIFGEIIPKNISVTMPEKVVFWLAPPLVFISKVLAPIVKVLDRFSNSFIRIFKVQPKTEVSNTYNIEEFSKIVAESKVQGTLIDEDNLISGVLEFSSRTAKEVMVSTQDVYTLSLPITVMDVEQAVKETGFSRFILLDSRREFHSYIHVKDILFAKEKDRMENLSNWRLRLLDTVNAEDEIEHVLGEMQKSGSHIAKVVEEDKTIGILFLEDIIEEIIGEVKDIMQIEEELEKA